MTNSEKDQIESKLPSALTILEQAYPGFDYEGAFLCEDQYVRQLKEIANVCKFPFTVGVPSQAILWWGNSHVRNIAMNQYRKTSVPSFEKRFDNSKNFIYLPGNGKRVSASSCIGSFNAPLLSTEVVFFDDDLLSICEVRREYVGASSSRTIPLTLKRMCTCMRANPACRPFFLTLVKALSDSYMIMKDVLTLLETNQGCELPIPIKDFVQFHNPKDFFTNRYRAAKDLPIAWNHIDLNTAYMAVKAVPHIDKESKTIACDTTNLRNISLITKNDFVMPGDKRGATCSSHMVDLFVMSFYQSKIQMRTQDKEFLSDYIYMCKNNHLKISLRFNSAKRIRAEHDKLSIKYTYKNVPAIKIPKNTRFKNLEKLLPPVFEKITSRKRLIQESIEQHNCVATYAKHINKDDCAIYSAIINNHRYTIEFDVTAKGEYVIGQMYQACNEAPIKSDVQYVRDLLAKQKIKE